MLRMCPSRLAGLCRCTQGSGRGSLSICFTFAKHQQFPAQEPWAKLQEPWTDEHIENDRWKLTCIFALSHTRCPKAVSPRAALKMEWEAEWIRENCLCMLMPSKVAQYRSWVWADAFSWCLVFFFPTLGAHRIVGLFQVVGWLKDRSPLNNQCALTVTCIRDFWASLVQIIHVNHILLSQIWIALFSPGACFQDFSTFTGPKWFRPWTHSALRAVRYGQEAQQPWEPRRFFFWMMFMMFCCLDFCFSVFVSNLCFAEIDFFLVSPFDHGAWRTRFLMVVDPPWTFCTGQGGQVWSF